MPQVTRGQVPNSTHDREKLDTSQAERVEPSQVTSPGTTPQDAPRMRGSPFDSDDVTTIADWQELLQIRHRRVKEVFGHQRIIIKVSATGASPRSPNPNTGAWSRCTTVITPESAGPSDSWRIGVAPSASTWVLLCRDKAADQEQFRPETCEVLGIPTWLLLILNKHLH